MRSIREISITATNQWEYYEQQPYLEYQLAVIDGLNLVTILHQQAQACLSSNMSDFYQTFLSQQDGDGIIDLLLFMLIIIWKQNKQIRF